MGSLDYCEQEIKASFNKRSTYSSSCYNGELQVQFTLYKKITWFQPWGKSYVPELLFFVCLFVALMGTQTNL